MAAELKQLNNDDTALAKVSQESGSIYDQVKTLVVNDQKSYDLASRLYDIALELEKQVHAAHDPVCDHWHELHSKACASRKADLDKVVDAKKLAKSKAATWADEQERIRLAEEQHLQEKERKRQEEAARIAREAEVAERKRLAVIEEEERLKLAAEAEASGATTEQVTEILETPLPIPEPEVAYVAPATPVTPTVAPTFKKAARVSGRWNYSANFLVIKELVKAAASNDFFLQYLQFNEMTINALARASKDEFKLPGCSLKKVRV